jgi:hypothetical protein
MSAIKRLALVLVLFFSIPSFAQIGSKYDVEDWPDPPARRLCSFNETLRGGFP